MGLACSQIRLLTLTARKADCEYGISIRSMGKIALMSEMSDLASEYQSKLSTKKIAYYHNGQFQNISYNYLMGYSTFNKTLGWNSQTQSFDGNVPIKEDNSMILTDYRGQVVLNKGYADAILSVLGSEAIDLDGRGGTFSLDQIPAMIAAFTNLSEENIRSVIDNNSTENTEFDYYGVDAVTGEETGTTGTKDTTSNTKSIYSNIVDFYYPIFAAAATNGWTTEYNNEIANNPDYVSDAIVSGTFQIETVDKFGGYNPGGSLTYYLMNGDVQERTDSDARQEVEAWYTAEKQRVAEKEDYLDLEIQDLSTELEIINTEIESVKSLIDDATQKIFDWGNA